MINKIENLYVFILLLVTLNSCHEREASALLTIPVDNQSVSALCLSEIALDIQSVPLELTDSSLIDINKVRRVFYDDNFILIQNMAPYSIMLFERTGKFIRRIGMVGQGSEEYMAISDIAVDFNNRRVIVVSQRRLICYDFNGTFIKNVLVQSQGLPSCLGFVDGKLLFIGREFESVLENGVRFSRSLMYQVDKDLHLVDSVELKRVTRPRMAWAQHHYNDHITQCGDKIYQYEFEFNPEPSLRDTLFQIKDMERIPSLRLDFYSSGIDVNGERKIYLLNVYRSSRYVFAYYGLAEINEYFCFCYDMKTGKGYCIKDGYTDDVKHDGTIVKMRPLIQNTDKFYYLVTDMSENSDSEEEPNPTLYIGTLKK